MRLTSFIVVVAAATLAGCTIDNKTTGPGTPVTIQWSPCINDVDAPAWFAVKDGDGLRARVAVATVVRDEPSDDRRADGEVGGGVIGNAGDAAIARPSAR